MKKAIIIASFIGVVLASFGLLIIISVAIGNYMGKEIEAKQYQTLEVNSGVLNNQLYAERYRKLVENQLKTNGYVTLERLVFYLQHTKNVLDITTLSDEEWEQAYLDNIDQEAKQMKPIKTICIQLKNDGLLNNSLENGTNSSGVEIHKVDLCNVDGEEVATSDNYSETLVDLPYVSPFDNSVSYTLTSMVFEYRNVKFNDLSSTTQTSVNYHSGWDFGVPFGTDIRSICDGKVTDIVMTQTADVTYDNQIGLKNTTGNYIYVECSNGYISQYLHIKYNSHNNLKVGDEVKKGDNIAKVSTTGISNGFHLHLGLKTKEGTRLDALSYIKFVEVEEK